MSKPVLPSGRPSPWIGRLIAACCLLGSLLLAGCAATGTKGAEMIEQISQVPAGKGRILIYRESTLVGAAVQPGVMVNGELVGASRPGSFFYADVSPGTHEVSARTEVTSRVAFQMAEGQTRYVRTSIGVGLLIGRVQLTLVDAEEAQRVLPSLAYTGTAAAGSPSAGAQPGTPPSTQPGQQPAPPAAAARKITLDDLDGLLPKKP